MVTEGGVFNAGFVTIVPGAVVGFVDCEEGIVAGKLPFTLV